MNEATQDRVLDEDGFIYLALVYAVFAE
jgi:hypothetical protein